MRSRFFQDVPARFSAVILAGGASRRMGRDKSWLEVDGQSLLSRQIACTKEVGAEEVFISGRAGGDYTEFKCRVLLDLKAGCGPLSGIERGLQAARTDLVLVLAVDLPFLDAEVIRVILGKCSRTVGLVPIVGRRMQPLVAVYPKACHEIARSMLQQGRFAVRDFARRCSGRGLVRIQRFGGPARAFTNWNEEGQL